MKKSLVVLVISMFVFFFRCEREVVKLVDDTTPPVITSFPEVVEITDSSATVLWATDEPCSVVVIYWDSTEIENYVSDGEYCQIHMVILSGLEDSTAYWGYTISYDMWNNFTVSDTFNFITRVNLPAILAEAWENFEDGDYQLALQYFMEYFNLSRNSAEVYCGIGWCKFFIDYTDTSIFYYFSETLDLQSENVDALCGLLYYSYYDSDYVSIMDFGRTLVELDSNYVFVHDTSINCYDVYTIMARACFELGFYSEAASYLEKITGVYIDEDKPDTWVVGGVRYDSYGEALDQMIKRCESSYLYLPGL